EARQALLQAGGLAGALQALDLVLGQADAHARDDHVVRLVELVDPVVGIGGGHEAVDAAALARDGGRLAGQARVVGVGPADREAVGAVGGALAVSVAPAPEATAERAGGVEAARR